MTNEKFGIYLTMTYKNAKKMTDSGMKMEFVKGQSATYSEATSTLRMEREQF